MTSAGRVLSLYVAMLVITVALMESTLALLSWFSPEVARLLAPPWNVVPDARLGHRPSPGVAGHDRRGWRNPYAYEKADVVALGDSQTYGNGVDDADAWPRLLEAMSGRSVYSMAMGGYGPIHSLILWDEALSLRPRMVIECFYAGNDLFDAFNMVYNRGQLPELKTASASVEQAVLHAESQYPLSKHIGKLFYMGESRPFDADPVSAPEHGFRAFLAAHSRIYGLSRRARYELQEHEGPQAGPNATSESTEVLARANPLYLEVLVEGPFKTILTPAYRLAALDLDDVRIAEGLRLSIDAMDSMAARAAADQVKFAVVLVPTKESVFSGLQAQHSTTYSALLRKEERVWDLVKADLDQHHVAYVDALPALRNALSSGVQPYPATPDGHPNRDGNLAIAQTVLPLVNQLGDVQSQAAAAPSH